MIRASKFMLAVATTFALTAGAALASGGGGGGGGGGDMPSASARRYDPTVEYQKGVTALQAKDFKEAEKAFNRVTQAAPQAAPAWFGLGRAKAERGDWKGARRAFEKAVELGPDDVASHAQLGAALAKLGETALAQAELDGLKQRAITCAAPCANGPALAAGIKYIQDAMTPAAAPAPAAALDPSDELLFAGPAEGDRSYGLALGLVNEGRYAEALDALNASQRAFGAHPDVLTYIGYTHRKMGEFKVAEDYYRQALAIAPNHRGATEYYGELKVVTGDVAGAKVMLTQLERMCAYGCEEVEELRRWIEAGGEPH